ncbi:MAG TPA: DUF4918 family protein [Bacteroidales bacterium]|nr:DUF4918 family protein [Bacteroidales bacterium]
MNNQTFAEKALQFYSRLDFTINLPEIEVMNPYRFPETFGLVSAFFNRFYSDSGQRTFIFGINPGRFGAGITGISFTDPVNLADKCHIPNHLQKKHELSSVFVYELIEAFGGTELFFNKFYVSAVSPLGFIKNGKNINYYDDKELSKAAEDFIRKCLLQQLDFGAERNCAICLGGNKNFIFLNRLNQEMNLFEKIIPLEHPRFIMQYRRKFLNQFLKKYLNALKNCE